MAEPRDVARQWVRDLALDVIEHDNCPGCKINAAIALEETGGLGELGPGADGPPARPGDAPNRPVVASKR